MFKILFAFYQATRHLIFQKIFISSLNDAFFSVGYSFRMYVFRSSKNNEEKKYMK